MHGGHYPAYHLRIFKKEKGKCEEKLYDHHFMINGEVAKIESNIINIIEPDLILLKNKQRKWAHLEAQENLVNKPERIGKDFKSNPIKKRKWLKHNFYYKMPLFVRPFLYFFYRYIWDGIFSLKGTDLVGQTRS